MSIPPEDRALIEAYLTSDRPSAESCFLSDWIDEAMLSAVLACDADDVRVVADRVREQMKAIIAEVDRQSDRQSMPVYIATADRSLAFEVRAGLALIADNRSLKSAERLRAFELWKENLS